MKKNLFLSVFLFIGITVGAVDSSYYSAIDGTSGTSLFSALTTVSGSGFSSVSYNNLWTAFCTTDVYPSDSIGKAGYIWDMYSDCLYECGGSKQGANYSSVGDAYNREHSLPKSWFNEATPMYSDLFHLYPTDGYVNNQRGNYAFGECANGTRLAGGARGRLGTSDSPITVVANTLAGTSTTCTATVFEPDDEYKGDFARSYMAMRVRYPGVNFAQADGGAIHFLTTTTAASATNYGLTNYSVVLLLKWHRQDPVSQKEIDRNNAIQTVQGNRNPFIDYPCLAEYLWGDKAGETVSLSSLVGSFEASFTAGSCDGCGITGPTITSPNEDVTIGTTTVNTAITKTITVQGTNLTSAVSLALSGANSSLFGLSSNSVSVANANNGYDVTITYTPTTTGTHTATLTLSSTDATSVVITLSGIAATPYTVTFDAEGGTCATNSLTETAVAAGVTLPTATVASACQTDGWTFAGWSTSSVTETSTTPTLYAANTTYYPTSNTTLYAVYKSDNGSGTATFTASDISNLTANSSLSWTHTASGIVLTLSAGSRYTNGTPNTFTITKATTNYFEIDGGSKTIQSLSVTVTGTNYVIGSVSGGTLTTNSTTQTVSDINATSVQCYATSGYQIRATEIEVSYGSSVYNSNPACSVSTGPTITSPNEDVTVGTTTVNMAITKMITVQGTNLTSAVSLALSGANSSLFGLSSNSVSAANANNGYNVTITYTPTTIGTHTATLTLSSTDATSVVITLSGTAATLYTVTFDAEGGTCATNSLTETAVAAGVTLPTATVASACQTDGWTFAGWSTSSVTETSTTPTLYAANTTYYPTSNTTLYAVYSVTEEVAGNADSSYQKVNYAPTVWDGVYLIVYETGAVALDGSLTELDATENTISVTISDTIIASTAATDASAFTVATSESGCTIQSASGYYIGGTANSNSLNSSTTTAYVNTLGVSNGEASIENADGAYLRYNSASAQLRFRYYKSPSYTSQQAICLYKKVVSVGSVSTTTYNSSPSCGVSCTTATCSFASPSLTKIITDANFINQFTTNNTSAVTYSIDKTDVATINSSTGEVTLKAVGSAIITATQEADATYCSVSAVYSLTVNKVTGSLSFDVNSITKKESDAAFTNSLTAVTDATVNYTSSNTAVATVDPTGQVTILKAGTTTITATAAATDRYTAASASYTLTVNALAFANLAFASTDISKTYGDAVFTNALTKSTTASVSYETSDAAVAMVNAAGQVTIVGAGSATISAIASANADYYADTTTFSLTVNKANSTVSFIETSIAKKVDDGNFVQTGICSVNGAALSYSSSVTSVATVDVSTGEVTILASGSTTITATYAGNTNYNGSNATYTLTVTSTGVVTDEGQTDLENNRILHYTQNDALHLANLIPGCTIKIYNALGKLLVNKINCSNRESFILPDGIYIIKVQTENTISTIKVRK